MNLDNAVSCFLVISYNFVEFSGKCLIEVIFYKNKKEIGVLIHHIESLDPEIKLWISLDDFIDESERIWVGDISTIPIGSFFISDDNSILFGFTVSSTCKDLYSYFINDELQKFKTLEEAELFYEGI